MKEIIIRDCTQCPYGEIKEAGKRPSHVFCELNKEKVGSFKEVVCQGRFKFPEFCGLAELGRFSLKDDKEFNFLVEIYDEMDEDRNRIREIEKYLSALFLKNPDLFGERFEPWLEQEKKSKKLAGMGDKK